MSAGFKPGDVVLRVSPQPRVVAEVAAQGRWLRLENPDSNTDWILAEHVILESVVKDSGS